MTADPRHEISRPAAHSLIASQGKRIRGIDEVLQRRALPRGFFRRRCH